MRTVDLKIEDIAFGGKGVARESGKAVFVPFTIDGETVTAEIRREKKKFAEAEVVAVRAPSPHRVLPECPYFGRCGGCSYQHIDYEHQLAIKWRQVRDILQRIGRIKDPPMRPIIPSPAPYHYRNRITVHVQDGIVGFFHRDSHRLIDIERCPIAMDEVNRALIELRASRPRDGHYSLRASPGGPRVFAQANDAVADALRNLISRFIPPDRNLLIDAYCGAGFFAKALLAKFDRIIGIDWDRFAIEAAKKNATEKETYIAGDVETELSRQLAAAVRGPSPERPGEASRTAMEAPQTEAEKTVLLVDPPATGLTALIRDAILNTPPETLIYVSCNPPTLARDLHDLAPRFTVESVTPLDMFPQTAEIEVAAHLQGRSGFQPL
jgi:23S rRNA (uracil1939-C5)-methyltransferase